MYKLRNIRLQNRSCDDKLSQLWFIIYISYVNVSEFRYERVILSLISVHDYIMEWPLSNRRNKICDV